MQGEIRPGYKQTEVGVIPEDWSVDQLGNVLTLQRGFDLPKRFRRSGPIPIVTSSGTEDFHDQAAVKGPGIVTGRYGTIGKVYFVEGDYWPLNTTLWLREFHGNDPLWAFRILQTVDFLSHSGKSGVPGVNRNDVHEEMICVPPIPEQRAIAEALGDADALIAALEGMIAKKRDLKQAAMQNLLTGKTRLPGFSGDWEVKRLGDVCDVDPDNLGSGTVPSYFFKYISLEDVNKGQLLGYSELEFRFAPSRARRKLRSDDILVSTVRPNLQAHLHFKSDAEDWVCSTGFAVLRCVEGKSNSGFIFQHLFGDAINQQIEKLITGSNYPAINSREVRALEILVPCETEQTAIAEVLSDMDADLAALEAEAAKARTVKQGMMQQLLTGKVRLI